MRVDINLTLPTFDLGNQETIADRKKLDELWKLKYNDGDEYFAQAGCGTAIDCNDFDSAISPQATESCDGVDNDCDGEVDESGSNQTNFYIDSDGDGYGNPSTAVLSCSEPFGYIPEGGDCDDTDAAINPNATEECDGVDNDCSGVPDDNLEVPLCENQHGVCNGATKKCNGVAGWAECNYLDYSDSYEADETTCDGLDNDCDGTADEDSCGAAIGTACLVDLDCFTGLCRDGVCCDSPCSGNCETCSGLGSGIPGFCGFIPQGLDPDAECPIGTACNGEGLCTVP